MPKKRAKVSKGDYWACPKTTKAFEIALYYGFTPQEPVTIEKADKENGKHFSTDGEMFIDPSEKSALVRKLFKDSTPATPIMIASARDLGRSDKSGIYTLDVVGTNQSIADATLIKVAYETVVSEGYSDVLVEINSIGDRESFSRYLRETGNFLKKHLNQFHGECRQQIKKDLYSVLNCSHQECKDMCAKMPYPINYLSEPSRIYFMGLLELLETTGIPYNLNNSLIANPECALHTIFRILGSSKDKKNEMIAYGSRWGLIAKKLGFKKDIQGISGTVKISRLKKCNDKMRIKKPQFYFIQMGQEAKYKSLSLIETLRKSKISVYHSLTKDKLTAQLSTAENLKVPYILIMGQKESLENTVLVRAMSNRCQETIHIEKITEYLRGII